MNRPVLGTLADTDTTQRRLVVYQASAQTVGVSVTVYGLQHGCVVLLDADGVRVLRGLLGAALDRLEPAQDT